MKNLLIDTDCGMDDIIAIAMIISNGNFSINGITTVRGLVTPKVGKKNLIKVLQYLKTDIEIVSGAASPINKSRLNYSFPKQDKVNSTKLTFLKSLFKPIKNSKQTYSATEFLFKKTDLLNEPTTLLCLGPLTNIAKAILKYKTNFTKNIDQILIMGGAVFTPGNVSPSRKAEYNIYLDPEAAEIVFSCRIPIKLISIDSTKYVPATDKVKEQIKNIKVTGRCGEIIRKTIIANKDDFNYFYDPLAAAILINPKLIIKSKRIGIKVLKDGGKVGQTLPILKLKNVEVVTNVNSKGFYKLLLKTLK